MQQQIRKTVTLAVAAGLAAGVAHAETPINFFEFTEWVYPEVGGASFPTAVWEISPDGRIASEMVNCSPSIFYGGPDIHNTRISGRLVGGGDDDLFGIVLGYTANDNLNPEADYLIIDWKRITQSFTWQDPPASAGSFHDVTPGTDSFAGLRLMRVRGTPTADELWGGVDLPENDVPPFAPGGVTEIARGKNMGFIGNPGDGLDFVIDYTPTNIKVWVNGQLEFDVNGDFPNGKMGLWEVAQDHPSGPNRYEFFSVGPIPADAPDYPYVAASARVDVAVKSVDGSDSEEDSIWTVLSTGTGAAEMVNVSPPNRADVSFAIGGLPVHRGFGVMPVSVRGNRTGGNVVVAETVNLGQFGGYIVGHTGVNTARALTGAEANIDISVAFFPYLGGPWIAGNINADGFTEGVTPGTTLFSTVVPTPDPNDGDGLYNLFVDGANSNTGGLLITTGGNNADRIVSSVAMPDGTWRVGVRRSGNTQFGGPQTFIRNRWNFVYLPINTPDLVGARVTGFDASGAAETDLSAGSYTLTRESEGLYRLNIPGVSPDQGVILMEANARIQLDNFPPFFGPADAPLNHWLSYDEDGNDFIIQQLEMADVLDRTDGPFTFVFVPHEGLGSGTGPTCPPDLNGDGVVDADDFFLFLSLFAAGDSRADFNNDGVIDADDFFAFLSAFAAGC
ncbi:MAG: hypothetical protein JJU33_10225 [Phycisphaerales bacterium]|nr:hypothetical protein [Phycisphaerales bacterium]